MTTNHDSTTDGDERWHIIRDPKTDRYELVGEWTEHGHTYGFRHSGLPEAIAKRLCTRLNAVAMRERNSVAKWDAE